MAYLADSTLAAIRQDPTKVVDYYNSTRATFLHDLIAKDPSMANLDETALKAAWCTVVAHDLTPYGTGPQTQDLNQLIAAPTMACAAYVSVAWQLLAEFGVPTTAEAAVGWDDGAVGNHAEFFYSDGTTNLLLDPTIGLVVNGATLQGIVGGTPYTHLASFFETSRFNIASFNTEVINAITAGLYKVRDAIYYVPTLDNWLHHYGDYQGLTIDNGNNSQTIVGSLYNDTLDAGTGNDIVYGGKGNDTLHLGDGNDFGYGGKGDDHIYGEGGNDSLVGEAGNDYLDGGAGDDRALFSGARAQYAISGNWASGFTVSGPDGTDKVVNVEQLKFSDQSVALTMSVVTAEDTAGKFSWSDTTTSFGAHGRRLSVLYDNDNHTHTEYDYDALSQFAWSSVQSQFDSKWNKTQQTYAEDDGTHVAYQYDVGNKSSWTSLENDFDTRGRKTSVLYNNDDGTHAAYQYDVGSKYTWLSVETELDSNWRTTEAIYNNDQGTHTVYAYNPQTAALLSTQTFDANWHLTA